MVGLIDHLESSLGEIQAGWGKALDGSNSPYQVARFAGGIEGATAYSTVGLRKHPMSSPSSGRMIRQELLLLGPQLGGEDVLAPVLFDIAASVVGHQQPTLRGDVIGPAGPLIDGATVTALYATMPVYFSDEFATFKDPAGGAVAIVWLVPITSEEAQFARRMGWQSLEDEMVSQDPDLLDYARDGMRLP